MSKNIETCKSEEVLASVTEQQPQDYPSVQQAVHVLGVLALPAASAADPDIAELPSNVEVFVRRVLKAVVYDRVLPVVQQMWQAVLNRISSPNYLPDSLRPYAQDPSLRTLGTLPTALSALSPRKISNGGATNDGIPDGVSLVHLLCEPASVVELKDDNVWGAISGSKLNLLPSLFPNAAKLRVGGSSLTYSGQIFSGNTSIEEMNFDEIHTIKHTATDYIWGLFYNMANLEVATFHNLVDGKNDPYSCLFHTAPKLKTIEFGKVKKLDGVCWNCGEIEEINIPTLEECSRIAIGCDKLKRVVCEGLTSITGYSYNPSLLANNHLLEYAYVPNITTYGVYGASEGAGSMQNMPSLAELHIGKAVFTNSGTNYLYALKNCDALIKLVIYGDLNQNLYLNSWNPTDKGTAFLENFLHHIAERLAVGPTTNRLTLTLSADVYSACGFGQTTEQGSVQSQIKKAIQDRNWKVTDGTNNFNQ